jgi:hypothetical protein
VFDKEGTLARRLSAVLAVVLSCASVWADQTVKAVVRPSSFEHASFPRWAQVLGYRDNELYRLTVGPLGCPFVEVDVSGTNVSLMLDSGTARGFVITNHVPVIPHRTEERIEEVNADGTHRGESFRIRADKISVLGKTFENVTGTLSDWRMFSSEPFNGTVGLDFFLDRRVTLDYQSGRVGATASPLPPRLDPKRYVVVDLVEPPKSQGHILYGRARVNGREALVYFDTGTNVSFIDPAFAEGLARVERSGRFKVFREGVPMEIGGRTFVFDDLREDPIRRGPGLDLPVALLLGSDVLSRFIVTIDIRTKKLVLATTE